VNPLDWAILGIGLLVFIFSFIDYYTFDCGRLCGSVSEGAWHGFFGWFAVLCAVAGSVLVALELFMPQFKMPIANRVLGLGLYAVATLCLILAIFIIPGYLGIDVPGSDKGHGFGFWFSLILVIGGLVVSLMRVQQTGTALPGALGSIPNIGGHGPQGGIGGPGGGARPGPGPGPGPGPNPPPPGYAPPQ
jgi:hypothetical protein